MEHVFVETNWVVGYAAPAHHKLRAAVALLERANAGEITLHLPAVCLIEARHPIMRLQPKYEADAIREFLPWARAALRIDAVDEAATRRVLDMFEGRIKSELRQVDAMLASLRSAAGVDVFGMDERMLALQTEFGSFGLDLKPFDQAILGAVHGRAEQLAREDAKGFRFCELDGDLQPWDRFGRSKPPLAKLYDERRIWVYGDFTMENPAPPPGWFDGTA